MRKIFFPIMITAALMLFNRCETMNPANWHPYSDIQPLSSFMELDYPYDIQRVELPGGETIAYIDEGQGKQTLLLIHGLGSYLPAWKKNVPELSKHFRVIAIDLPGYGKSSKLPHSGMMTYYAGVVSDFIDALGLESVVLGGHSMGGQISMVTALYHPGKVDKLVLIAPAGFEKFTEGQKEWFRSVMTVRGVMLTPVEDIISNLAYNFYQLPDDAEFMITDRIAMRSAEDFRAYCYAVVQSVNGMVDEATYEYLHKIQHPTLIIFGENDNLIPNRFLNPGFTRDVANAGAERIPNNELHLIPKSGHFVQFESADKFNQIVIDYLSK
ncbi:MAG: alpha/beta hydrolase [Bacteroidetes bacterium]|nr:MAG: alpha/beta hydrolase [Bacteroidota bacterium]